MFEPYRPPQNRFANINFGSDTAMERNQPQAEAQSKENSFADVYSRLANAPSGPANQKYKDFLDSAEPSRADYEPSKMQRFGAILSGVGGGGIERTQSILDRPYNEAMEARNRQGGILKAGADVENNDFKSRIGMMKDISDAANVDADNKRADFVAESTIAKNRKQVEQMDYTMKNSGFTATTNNEGFRIYTSPTGEVRNTGIKVAQSPAEKLADQKNLAQFGSNLTFGRNKSLFDYEQPIRESAATSLQERGIEAANNRQLENQAAAINRDNANPTRQGNQQWRAAENVISKRISSDPGIAEEFDEKGRPLTLKAKRLFDAELASLQMQNSAGGIPGAVDPRLIGGQVEVP
tara:strand:- start:480 stop:1535 length:1056 start_codon:yes stop_codon:yes gene_type:complete